MSINIQQLAEQVLSEVTTSEKTASTNDAPISAFKTEVGQSLKAAAELVRALDDVTPTNDDLLQVRTAQCATKADHTKKKLPEAGSKLGNSIRKMANDLRTTGLQNEELRATKTAKLINAAVALQHLGGK